VVPLIRSNESIDRLCTFKLWAWSVYWSSAVRPPACRGDPALNPKVAISRPVPSFPPPVIERVARLGGRDEVHVAVGQGNEMSTVIARVTGSVSMTWIMFTVRRACARRPLEDLLVQDHGAARIGIVVFGRGRHVNRRASVDTQTDEGRTLGRAGRRGAVAVRAARHRDTASAHTPLRRFACSTVALLWAWLVGPIDPVVTTPGCSMPRHWAPAIAHQRNR